MVAEQPVANIPIPPPANGAAGAPDIDKLLAEEDVSLIPQVKANDKLDMELGMRFKAAEDARRDIELEMWQSFYRREGKYSPEVYAKLKAAKGSRMFSNITEGKCGAAEANFVNMILFSPARAWGLESSPIPELEGDAALAVAKKAEAMVGEVEGLTFEQALEALLAEHKKAAKEEADKRAERMQRLIDDQFDEGGWRKAARSVISDFCTYEIAGFLGPVIVKERRSMVVGTSFAYQERLVPKIMRLDPFGIYVAAGATDAADADCFYRVLISDDAAVELISAPNILTDRAELAYRRKGTMVGSGDVDHQKAEEQQRIQDPTGEATNPDGKHELVWWWHRMTREEAAGVMRQELPEDAKPNERIGYMGLMLNGVVISCMENWDPDGKPQIHLCSFRQRPDSPYGRSLPWLNKDPQNQRNVSSRALHTNILSSSSPMVEASLDRLMDPWDSTQMYPGKVIPTKPPSVPDGRGALTMLQTPNFTTQMLAAVNQAGAWSDDATGIYPQAYGAARQTGPAETMGGYQMLREDQMTVLKLAIISLDEAVRSLVDSFWKWNIRTPGHDDCKGDFNVVPMGMVKLFLDDQTAAKRERMIAFYDERKDLAAVSLKPNGLLRMQREWFIMSGMDPDEYLLTEEEADAEREKQRQAAEEQARREAEAAAGNDGGGDVPPQAKPESESDRIRAEADMARARAAERKVAVEEGKLAIARADAAARARKAIREEREARARIPQLAGIEGGNGE